MQNFDWASLAQILLQFGLAYLTQRNHKSIVETHRCIERAKFNSENQHEFVKDYLNQISEDLKTKT